MSGMAVERGVWIGVLGGWYKWTDPGHNADAEQERLDRLSLGVASMVTAIDASEPARGESVSR